MPFTVDGVFGTYTSLDGTFKCKTAEHSYQQLDGSFAPKLPSGTYTCQKKMSQHFGEIVFVILNVPGHSAVEIHRGDFPQVDSDGCTLLGEYICPINGDPGARMIANSKEAFMAFMALQKDTQEFTLTVIDN